MACHSLPKGLVVFTVDAPQRLQASVHAWRDVSPPELTATTEEKMETMLLTVHVRLAHPPIEIGTIPFDLGAVELMAGSTAAAVDFWHSCVAHTGRVGLRDWSTGPALAVGRHSRGANRPEWQSPGGHVP